jgi:RimJ/RimL family protein N-acetyltransferase
MVAAVSVRADGSGNAEPGGVAGTPGAPVATPPEEPGRPPGYPSDLERDVRTLSGESVHVRPIRPDDAPALVAFHAGLSAQTVYLRFFTFHPVLTPREVERFTRVDYCDRLALVVESERRLVAIARYDREAGTDEAEVAFIVGDEHQHQGLGTLLADELARAAWARGIRSFVADTLADNAGMLEVFHGLGFPVTSVFDEGVVRIRFPIEPVPSYADALARREATRRLPAPPC